MTKLSVFKNIFVHELKDKINSNINFYNGEEQSIPYDEKNILLSDIDVNTTSPGLEPSKDKDIENAIKLYEYLPLNETQASDKRLWTYLTHITFKNYTRERWLNDKTLEKNIYERWFIAGNSARALRRNAISRLWWAVHLTVSPWKSDDYFASLKNDDKYVYTKTLKNEDIMQALLERKIGWSQKLLIAILEYMRKNTEIAYKRDFYRPFIREIMLDLGYSKIMILSFDELLAKIYSIASDIKPNADI